MRKIKNFLKYVAKRNMMFNAFCPTGMVPVNFVK